MVAPRSYGFDHETYFKPFRLREHTQWLSSRDRALPSRQRPPPISRTLKRTADQKGTSNVKRWLWNKTLQSHLAF